MNFSAPLRRELADLALKFARKYSLSHNFSLAEKPIVCFTDDNSAHGNFHPTSYRAILSNPSWRRRLTKAHTSRRSLPSFGHRGWRELDACTSSDALLMNIFCHPMTLRSSNIAALLGAEPGDSPRFGIPARVPLLDGGCDRTEIDMRLGDFLVEAKLTEGNFQKAKRSVLAVYRDFAEVFTTEDLPQTETHYLSYQLLRNVLAAHATGRRFCVLLDARRPDLIEAWFGVMKCVKDASLRTRLRVMTWQELATALPSSLRNFLSAKYGIDPAR
ncbi:MAG TPA: hypothetical protein VMH04_10075 [Candidatus Solibacter sp.]|nr:hypothetical protein [Candidatus Solibacter sp.]